VVDDQDLVSGREFPQVPGLIPGDPDIGVDGPGIDPEGPGGDVRVLQGFGMHQEEAPEELPTSIPSPGARLLQVSTQTRSPMPKGLRRVILAVVKVTGIEASFTRRAIFLITAGAALVTTRPSTPVSSIPRAVRAPSSSLTSTKMLRL